MITVPIISVSSGFGEMITMGCWEFTMNFFYFMEDRQINELHIGALPYIFLPQINKKLDMWRTAWSTHRICTTPLRLWLSGPLNNPIGIELTNDTDIMNYGVDGAVPQEHESGQGDRRPIFEAPTRFLESQCLEILNDSIMTNRNENYLSALRIIEQYNKQDDL